MKGRHIFSTSFWPLVKERTLEARRTIVTAALPYANGDIHMGHVCSTYVPADVYTRFLRLRGEQAVYVCGADEHGTPIEMSARERGMDPASYAEFYRLRQLRDLESMGVRFDNYHRTHSDENRRLTEHFLLKMRENGYIYSKEVESYYCEHDKKYLPDRFVIGTCPYCGAENQYSDQCEVCQRALEPGEILNPRCAICGSTPITKKTTHFFFKLSAFSDRLSEWIRSKSNRDFPREVVNHVLGWIAGGLKDWDITREDYWGFKLPYTDASPEQYAYVWVDAPICYFASFINWAERTDPDRKKWLSDPATRLVHFIGKDIVQHHLIFWPSMLMAVDEFVLPSKYVVNGYISLEGRKMSKSRGWYIPVQRATSRYPSDYLRFYLAYKASNTTGDSNFSWTEFRDRINRELADNIGNFVHRVLSFTQNNFGGRVPSPGPLSPEDRRFREEFEEAFAGISKDYEDCNLSRVVQGLVGAFMLANRYFNEKRPWESVKRKVEDAATTMYLSLCFVKRAAAYLYPITPNIADEIWEMLGEEKGLEESRPLSSGYDLDVHPGTEIPRPKPLVTKVEEEKIKEEQERLKGELGREEEPMPQNQVSIEEFKKLDIRTARILEAKRVKGSRNLIKLKIDVGEERTLVAGLAEYYSPEELVGKNIVILANLKPAKIFGIESQGMLLAAVGGDKVSILVPDREVSPGTHVE